MMTLFEWTSAGLLDTADFSRPRQRRNFGWCPRLEWLASKFSLSPSTSPVVSALSSFCSHARKRWSGTENISLATGRQRLTISVQFCGRSGSRSQRKATRTSAALRPLPWRKIPMSGLGCGSGEVWQSKSRCAGSRIGASGEGASSGRNSSGSGMSARRASKPKSTVRISLPLPAGWAVALFQRNSQVARSASP